MRLHPRATRASASPKPTIRKHDHTYAYNGQTIAYSIWAAHDGTPVHTIIFLGTVQVGRLPAWIARRSQPGTLVVQGAPHWLAHSDGSDIPAFMYRFTDAAFTAIQSTRPLAQVRVVAESQAAPGVLHVLASNEALRARVAGLVLVQPLGFNSSAFGATTEQRASTFKARVNQNLQLQLPTLLSDWRLVYNHQQMVRIVGYNNAKADAQYGAGLAHDATADLAAVTTASLPVAMVCGGSDKLFPVAEVRQTLAANKLDVRLVTVPGIPHSPMVSRQGMRLLGVALEQAQRLSRGGQPQDLR